MSQQEFMREAIALAIENVAKGGGPFGCVIVKDGRVWFHLARRNRIADHLEGQPVLISLSGREGYQSANWYSTDDQVPTWHYEAVEIEGSRGGCGTRNSSSCSTC